MERLRAHNLLTFKMDVSVWDELIDYERGASGSLYTLAEIILECGIYYSDAKRKTKNVESSENGGSEG